MTWALLGFSASCIAALTTLAVLAYRARGETLACRDLLDAKDTLADQYQSERDVLAVRLAVATDQLQQTRDRLAIAEAQRNEAMRKARAYLTQALANASEKDIDDAIVGLFASPLGVVSPQVPTSGDSSAGPDDLEVP
jgi:hypothetical protein